MLDQILEHCQNSSPFLMWFFVVMGVLNGLAAGMEHVVSKLPQDKVGAFGKFLMGLRAGIQAVQRLLEFFIAKRKK